MKNLLLAGIVTWAVLMLVLAQAQGIELSGLDFADAKSVFMTLPEENWSKTRNPDGTYRFTYPYRLEFTLWNGKPISVDTLGVVDALTLEGMLRVTTADITDMVVQGAEGRLAMPISRTLVHLSLYKDQELSLNLEFKPTAILTYERDMVKVKNIRLRCRALRGQKPFIERIINVYCERFLMSIVAPQPFEVPTAMINPIIDNFLNEIK